MLESTNHPSSRNPIPIDLRVSHGAVGHGQRDSRLHPQHLQYGRLHVGHLQAIIVRRQVPVPDHRIDLPLQTGLNFRVVGDVR